MNILRLTNHLFQPEVYFYIFYFLNYIRNFETGSFSLMHNQTACISNIEKKKTKKFNLDRIWKF